MPDSNQVQGVPEGLIETPVDTATPAAAPIAAPVEQVEGVPPGLIATPIEQAPTAVTEDGRAVLGRGVIKAVTAPTTLFGQLRDTPAGAAAGTPYEGVAKIGKAIEDSLVSTEAKQKWAQVGQGALDVLHGNISQGLHSMWAAASPHITAGSPLEKQFQAMNPGFKGTAPIPDDRISLAPVVDVGQFIDKQKHPIMKAVAEAGSSFTTPTNIAIMSSTGGFGLVRSPQALSMANKLLSMGFAAQAIGSAYKNLEGFKEAYDKGDAAEAQYQLTHAVLSGSVATMATAHAAGEPLPLAAPRDIAAARFVGERAGEVAAIPGKVADMAAVATGKVVGTAAAKLGFGEDFDTLIKKISPPSKGKAIDYGGQVKAASPFLKDILNTNPEIGTPKDFADAIEQRRKAIDAQLLNKAESVRGTPQAEMPGIEQRIDKAIDDAFEKQGARYKPAEREAAKQAVKDFLLQDKIVDGMPVLSAPDLFDTEKIRQRFNDDTRPVFGQDPGIVPSATTFAKKIAADEARSAIDEKYGQLGIQGVKEWRKLESSVIPVRDQLELAQKKAEEMGEFNLLHSAIRNVGWPIVLGALGHGPGGLAVEAIRIGQDYFTDRTKNPNTVIQRAAKRATEEGAPAPTVPTPGPLMPEAAPVLPPADPKLHADLATHYGELAGRSEYQNLESRFISEIESKSQHGIPLEPAEKALLGKINAARLTPPEPPKSPEGGKPVAKEAAPEVEGVPEGLIAEPIEAAPAAAAIPTEATHVYNPETKKIEPVAKPAAEDLTKMEAKAPFETTDKELSIPENYAKMGITPERARTHEAGHHVVLNGLGFKTIDTLSHLHPEVSEFGALAKARWDDSPFKDENGKIDEEKVKLRARDLIAGLFGGPVAEELIHGVPVEGNPGAKGDLERVRKILDMTGRSPKEINQVFNEEKARAKNILTRGKTQDILQKYTQNREAGIPDTHLMTAGTTQKMLQEIGEANDYDNEQISRRVGRSGQEDVSREEGRVGEGNRPATQPEAAAQEVTAAQERVPYKEGLKVPPERSTGTPEHDIAIKAGGGIPGGTMKGDPSIKLPGLTMFHDPTTGSTLAFREGDTITPQAVREKLRTSRQEYLKAKPEESRIPEKGQAGYIEPEPTKMEATAAAEPKSISDKLVEKYGTTDSPLKAAFILNDGRMIPLSGDHNDMIATAVKGAPPSTMAQLKADEAEGLTREDLIRNEKAIRTRFRTGRGGDELVFSVPKTGVSEEQIAQMRQSIGKMGRHGNVVMEVAEPGGKSITKEFALPSHVDGMLREIGAHPEGPEVTKMEATTPEWIPPKGIEKGIPRDEAVKTEIPLSKLSVQETAYNGALSDIFRGRGSKTEGPVRIVYNQQNGQYLVEDGMHRIVAAHQKGAMSIPAEIWSGYSDVDTVRPESKMDMSPIKDWADKAEQDAKEQGGGFTVDPRTGKAPTSGYMVEAHTEGRKILDHPATADDIREFHDEHKDLFDKHSELHVGGFENELNVSANVPDRAAAIAVAKKLDQRSIWDVKKGEEIPTGGEGKQTEFPGYPLEQRLAELKGENKFSAVAKSLADSIGAKVVGSVTKAGVIPHDIDLRIEGNYDRTAVETKMKQAGFEPSGSSVMSPKEVEKYRKYVGGAGWKRMEHFEDATGRKVDIWHDEPESKKISPGVQMLAGK